MATLVQNLLRIGDKAAAPYVKRRQFLASFDDAALGYPRERCVHELLEKQVERSPDAIAVSSRYEQITYAELNARANQLARFLKRFGVGPDSIVGLCVERSTEMIVGILGILKAGAGYVALDPTDPRDRVLSMMEDAKVFVLLTQAHLLDSLPKHNGPRLSLDSDWDVIAKERNDNPQPSRDF